MTQQQQQLLGRNGTLTQTGHAACTSRYMAHTLHESSQAVCRCADADRAQLRAPDRLRCSLLT